MPRRPRLELPGMPLHIIQRGVNRCAVFIDNDDRRLYLHLLLRACRDFDIAVHAYVLMGNHVHLLATSLTPGAISDAMHRLGQCYVQAFNRKHQRTGTLWDGRFKSCLVDSETYLLTVYRYIECNPVRAAMINSPAHYHWSSAQGNLGLRHDPVLTPHPVYIGLAGDQQTREKVYAQLLNEATSQDDLDAIRSHSKQEKALGSEQFQAKVEQLLGTEVSYKPLGRPSKKAKT